VTGYLLRRLVAAVPLFVGAATLVFLLVHLVPGDPVRVMLGAGARESDVAEFRHRLGLDLPLVVQYLRYMGGLLRGDAGVSLHYQDPVGALLLERLPDTARLAGATLFAALLIAGPAGLLAAARPGGWFDRFTTALAALALAMPSFWLGPLLVLGFSIGLGWFPVSGSEAPGALILPAATLAFPIAALVTRLLAVALRRETATGYVAAARARGRGAVGALAHALRNAAGPVVTVIGLQTGSLLTGAILTEMVFAWPGIGRLLVRAITYRDFPLVQGCVLAFALIYMTANLACDVLRATLDPRLGTDA
jgi:peptide/nickel transport system permease protein